MSYTSLTYHIVFSTRKRNSFLDNEKMQRLSEYVAGIIRNLKCHLYVANGTADHIHLAVSLRPQISLADFMRTVKASSSRWIHETFPKINNFSWQDGYSAFTVSHSVLSRVIEYIKGQQEHHKRMTFEQELVGFLKKHKIVFDEKYISV
jgi:putative transposase